MGHLRLPKRLNLKRFVKCLWKQQQEVTTTTTTATTTTFKLLDRESTLYMVLYTVHSVQFYEIDLMLM